MIDERQGRLREAGTRASLAKPACLVAAAADRTPPGDA